MIKAREDYQAFIGQMEHDYPEYYDLKYNYEPTKLETVQSRLPDSTLLVEYLIKTAEAAGEIGTPQIRRIART